MTQSADASSRLRWVVLFVFMLSSSLSYLDRQLLSAQALSLQNEFHLTGAEFGYLISAFSLAYALSAPLSGPLIDRFGLDRGVTYGIGLWSLAGVATGFTGGILGLLVCRVWLGAAESANVPSAGKSVGVYLRPEERALGTAMGQMGISIGMIGAPIVQGLLAPAYGWRITFVFAGLLGFAWIPLWLWTSAKAPWNPMPPASTKPIGDLLREKRFWGLIAANILSMTIYSLWMNWTTKFLVQTYSLSQEDANLRLAWIPAIFAALGSFAGGAISLRLARQGKSVVQARYGAILIGAIAVLATAAAPHLPNATLGTAAICWSFFWCVAISGNVYALPVDYFGPERAATGVSALVFGYGLMQTAISPLIGGIADRYGFAPVCAAVACLPLAAYGVLRWTGDRE